jgi:hypothetical protein
VGAVVHLQVHRDKEEVRVFKVGVASEAGSTGVGVSWCSGWQARRLFRFRHRSLSSGSVVALWFSLGGVKVLAEEVRVCGDYVLVESVGGRVRGRVYLTEEVLSPCFAGLFV